MHTYTTSDGLALDGAIFQAMQDSRGFLWFVTSATPRDIVLAKDSRFNHHARVYRGARLPPRPGRFPSSNRKPRLPRRGRVVRWAHCVQCRGASMLTLLIAKEPGYGAAVVVVENTTWLISACESTAPMKTARLLSLAYISPCAVKAARS